jgi:hypothetical protein
VTPGLQKKGNVHERFPSIVEIYCCVAVLLPQYVGEEGGSSEKISYVYLSVKVAFDVIYTRMITLAIHNTVH